MLKITAITLGKYTPASRFRVRQYISGLRENDILVSEYASLIPYDAKIPIKIRMRYLGPISFTWQFLKILGTSPALVASHFSDIVWLNRGMAGGYNIMEQLLKKPIYYDIDDALWISNPSIFKQALQSYAVIAGNSFIAEKFSKYNRNIYVVPTAIDTNRFIANSAISKDDKFIIGWSGSADGLKYLYEIEEQLNSFLKNHKNAFIKVICDQPPKFKIISHDKIIYVPWNPLIENTELCDISVGIMPLTDNEWSRGKCSFKMLQYMSTALPVIVSDVGMNSEILAKDDIGFGIKKPTDWLIALNTLYNDKTLCNTMGIKGRALIEKEYSLTVVTDKLSEIFLKK